MYLYEGPCGLYSIAFLVSQGVVRVCSVVHVSLETRSRFDGLLTALKGLVTAC